MHFHYYATYLAARLAGMSQSIAQQLASYCQGMAEMDIGSQATLPWYFQGQKFSPCITGSPVINDDLGIYHSELAFRRLPAFEVPSTSVVRVEKVDAAKRAACHSVRSNAVAQIDGQSSEHSQHAYNPLTDVDWKGGGRIKPSFGQKIAAKLAHFRRQSEVIERVPLVASKVEPETEQRLTGLDARLKCLSNSQFSRDMLNDSIYKSRYCNKVKGMTLALLGCRLFTYQNTWHHSLQATASLKTQSANRLDNAKKRVETFYWTLYAIECFERDETMQGKLHLNGQKSAADSAMLDSMLLSLFSFNGDALEKEFMWLNSLPDLLGHYGLAQTAPPANWWDGFRYRPNHLLEQAMLSSGGGLSRDIKHLQAFKDSDFFKLNKAAEYHADWLSRELKQRDMGFYSTAQNCGDTSLFQL